MNSINIVEAEQKLDQLAFGYACASLSKEDLGQVEQELIKLPDFQSRLAYWNQYQAELDQSLEAVSAPAVVWRNIRQHITGSVMVSGKSPKAASKSFAHHLAKGLEDWWLGLRGAGWGVVASVMLVALVVFTMQPKSPVYLDDQWVVKSNLNRNIITLVAVSPSPIPAGIVCNLWITNDEGALFVAALPKHGEVVIDLSNHPDVLKKLNQPGLLQVTFDPEGSQPQTMGAVMLETHWII